MSGATSGANGSVSGVLTPMLALVRNDLRLYVADRRAVIVGILVPILIAAFFGYVFGGAGHSDSGKIAVGYVDEDGSAVSRAIGESLTRDAMLEVHTLSRAEASAQVAAGKVPAAAVVPAGFGRASVGALFTGADKPHAEFLVDPSATMSSRVLQGLFTQYAMQSISREAFSGALGRTQLDAAITQLSASQNADVPSRAQLLDLVRSARQYMDSGAGNGTGPLARGFSIPYEIDMHELAGKTTQPYNGYAHSFAGMAVQFILFAGIDAGILLLLARERGLWQRVRAAPLRRWQFLVARTVGTSLISLFQFTAIYLVAVLMFRVPIAHPGAFALLAIAFCFLNASFGLLLASIGGSASVTRSLAMMVTLLLVMLGGAWVPSFVFPRWLQQASLLAPTRWAVDGFDAMTWRAQAVSAVVSPTLILLATGAACLAVAVWRFRWND